MVRLQADSSKIGHHCLRVLLPGIRTQWFYPRRSLRSLDIRPAGFGRGPWTSSQEASDTSSSPQWAFPKHPAHCPPARLRIRSVLPPRCPMPPLPPPLAAVARAPAAALACVAHPAAVRPSAPMALVAETQSQPSEGGTVGGSRDHGPMEHSARMVGTLEA